MTNFDFNLSLIANIFAVAMVIAGISLLVILICKSYLNLIFRHVDEVLLSSSNDRQNAILSTLRKNESWFYHIIKRSTDLFISMTAWLLVLPLFLCIVILIKIETPGPLFVRQKRFGYMMYECYIYKFRTLKHIDDENNFGKEDVRKINSDPRLTKVGTFLRKTSLDEIPMLINLLRGEISIVGTSGASDYPIHEEWDDNKIEAYFNIKPGIISLWSLSGSRWNLDLDKRLTYDLYYIENQSTALDFAMLLMAFPSIMGRVGSY